MAELSQEEREELNAIYSSRTTSARNLVHEELLDHLGYEGLLRVFYVPREGQPATQRVSTNRRRIRGHRKTADSVNPPGDQFPVSGR